MKFGDPVAAHECGILITNALLGNQIISSAIKKGEELILTASASGVVPTASHAVMNTVAVQLREKGVPVSQSSP